MKIDVLEGNVLLFTTEDAQWVDNSVADTIAYVTEEEYLDLSNLSLPANSIIKIIPSANLTEGLYGNVVVSSGVSMANINLALRKSASQTISFDDPDIRTLGQCCDEESVGFGVLADTPVSMSNFYNTPRFFKIATGSNTSYTIDGITPSRIKQTMIQHMLYDRFDIEDMQFFTTYPAGDGTVPSMANNGANIHIWLTSTNSTGWEYLKLLPNLKVDHYVRISNNSFPSQQKYSLDCRIDVGGDYIYSDIAWGANIYFNGPQGFRDYPLVIFISTGRKDGAGLPLCNANAFTTLTNPIPNRVTTCIGVNGGWNYPILHTDVGTHQYYATDSRFVAAPTTTFSNIAFWRASYSSNTAGGSLGPGRLDDGSELYVFDNISRNNNTTVNSYPYRYFVCGTNENKKSNHYKVVTYGNSYGGGYLWGSNSSLSRRGTGNAMQVVDTRGGTYNRDHIWVNQGVSGILRSQGSNYNITIAASTEINGKAHYNLTRFRANAIPRPQNWSKDIFIYNQGTQSNLWVTGIGDDYHPRNSLAAGETVPTLVVGEIEYDTNASDVFIARHQKSDGSMTHFNTITSRFTENGGDQSKKARWTIRIARNNTLSGSVSSYTSSATAEDYTFMNLNFIIWDKKRIVPGFFWVQASNLLNTVGTVFSNRAGPTNNTFCNQVEIVGSGGEKYKVGANIFSIYNIRPYIGSAFVPYGPSESALYTLEDYNSSSTSPQGPAGKDGGGVELQNCLDWNYANANVYSPASMIVTNYLTLENISGSFVRRRIY
ncbi:MAG: hypothetical protein EBU90_11015 [Proteobacteria bacterium]|nr:hypothetical protein [Pseudomonadota bacterium]